MSKEWNRDLSEIRDPSASLNTERLFHALNGQGKTAALYVYPFEDHGQATQETLLDLWTRWLAWLDRYVKNPAQPTPPADPPVVAGEAAVFVLP